MSENSLSVEDHNKENGKEDDESNAITMVDVLNEESELEEDAKAVLGGSDPLNCTYPKGYVKRQALYACLSCIPPSKESRSGSGGLCLACSYSCHEGHELVELYTKRNFRCDCGSCVFGGNKCNLDPSKEVNTKNRYNDNFKGLYCICKRPYPDPDDTVGDEMIQCIVCEDWYHGRHLGAETSIPDDYGEMICESCMNDHQFLWKYASLCLTKKKASENTVDVCGTPEKACGSNSTMDTPETPATVGTPTGAENSPQKSSDSSVTQVKGTGCILLDLKAVKTWKGATFWPEGWRKQLCVCSDCETIYTSEGVEYLTDVQDTVQYYEEQGKATASGGEGSQYDRAMQALSKLDRVKQVEAIHGYNDMKDHLKEYLQKFADSGKVVREEDIREFFSQMSRKRQRVDLPTFCR